MTTVTTISLFTMAAIYIFAGLSHFRIPKFFLSITPQWVPKPELVNHVVGLVEVLLGLGLLFSATRTYALYGIIALLIIVFPANIYHFQKARKKQKQVWMTIIRLPIQFLLIWWAYSYL
ncbi:MAG: DoxX family protein [Saprospiraceae bacterium]